MSENNIVKAESKTPKYNYASLSDIANQGFKIPKMRTMTCELNGKDYVEYYDEDLKEWIRGCEIVIPDVVLNKDGKEVSNICQRLGSALTYSRRYTTHLALGLACDNDKDVEYSNEDIPQASDKQINYILKLYNAESIEKIKAYYKIGDIEDLNVAQAKEVIEQAKKRNEAKGNQ